MNLIHATLGYLALPLLIFLLGWLKPVYALPLAALLVWLLIDYAGGGGENRTGAKSNANFSAKPCARSLLVCAVVALLWTAASGAGGFGFQTGDYLKHNAMLKTLLSNDWPVFLGPDKSLVYTLGYYLPAAAFGKLFGATDLGWKAVNLFMYAWTAAGACLALLWFVRHVRGRPELFAPLFVVLGGLDVIAWLLVPRDDLEMEPFPAGIGYLQFSGMTTVLNWVPQHAFPAWLGGALFLQLKDEPGFYKNAALLGACLILWSSFAALGVALLIVAWLAIKPRYFLDVFTARALSRQSGGILLAAAVLLYIMSSNFTVPHGIFAITITEHGLWPRYVFFLLVEFGLVAIASFALTPKGNWRRRMLIALGIILAAVPLYRVGFYHDMAMRASLPALFVFWCLVFRAFPEQSSRRFHALALKSLILAAAGIGSVTALQQLGAGLGIQYRLTIAMQVGAIAALRQELDGWSIKLLAPPPLEAVLDIGKPADKGGIFLAEQYHGRRHSLFFRLLASEDPS